MTTTNSEPESNCVVPEVALRWLILHATTSNAELAHLSNVNRSWRDVTTTVVLEQATNKTAGSGPLLLLPSMVSQLMRMNAQAATEGDAVMKEAGANPTIAAATATTTTNGSEEKPTTDETNDDDNDDNSQALPSIPEETFCAAWFAPEGIQLLDLDAEQQLSEEDESSDDFSNTNNNSNNNNNSAQSSKSRQGMHRHCRHATGSNAQKKKKNAHPTARSKSPMMMMNFQRRPPKLEQIPPSPQAWGRAYHVQVRPSFEDQGILVSHEWRGYRHAMEVLYPFGYAEFFVQHVLQKAQVHDQMRRREGHPLMDISDSVDDVNRRTSSNLEPQVEDYTQATIAVRGATMARPEGYCLCWEYPVSVTQQPMEWTQTSPFDDESQKDDKKHNEEMVQTIKWQERQRKLKQWKEWRRQLQLTVLPQVLVRKPPNSCAVVQFLNSDEKHAVRFLTPKFQCGPIGEPVTIFVVGIATEDGCFCSGLQHRFELGHLYPNSPLAELAEMSPVCIATDPWEYTPKPKDDSKTTGPKRTPLEQHLAAGDDSEDESVEDYSNEDDEDDSSDLADDSNHVPPHKKRGWLNNCACIFHDNSDPCGFASEDSNSENGNKGTNSNNDNDGAKASSEREDSQTLRDDDDDEEDGGGDAGDHDADRIVRGSRVPGMWHCYTAVFDGKNSVIRVDGVAEVLTTERNAAKKNSGPSSDVHKKGPRSRRQGPRPMLDGLTIGSDHCFDMTLCFGQGSGGEGEGAIAEIAVFGGCLDTKDLEVIERQLMAKHGIPAPKMTRQALVREDEWTRRAHALYCQIPPEAAAVHLRQGDGTVPTSDQQTIPLRVMAKHRSVAWHQVNSVTGEELRIKRIGSRSAGSSSDW